MPVLAIFQTARWTLLQLLKSRLLWLLLPAELLMCAIPTIMSGHHHPPPADDAFAVLGFWMYILMMAPWVGMFFGIQASHGDIEDRTFQYLLLRPVPRGFLLLGKWLASALLAAAVVTLGLCLMWSAISLLPFQWNSGSPDLRLLGVYCGAAAIATVAYSAVAVLFGTWFRRPLVWAVFFVVGLEYFISNLPPEAGVRSLTVADPVRRLLLLWLEPSRKMARMIWPSQQEWDPEKLGNPQGSLVLLIACFVLAAVWVYSRTEYDSRERE